MAAQVCLPWTAILMYIGDKHHGYIEFRLTA